MQGTQERSGASLSPELMVLLTFEDMLIFNKELEDAEKYANFVALEREYREQQLLQEINAEDEG